MASKGQKFNKYTEDIINEVLNELIIGKSSLQISKERNIPAKTIRTWKLKRILHPELYPNQGQKRGRPKNQIWSCNERKEGFKNNEKIQFDGRIH